MTPPPTTTTALQESQYEMVEYYRELFGEEPARSTHMQEMGAPSIEDTYVYEETIFAGEGRRLGGTRMFDSLSEHGRPGNRRMDHVSQIVDVGMSATINGMIRKGEDMRVYHIVDGQLYQRVIDSDRIQMVE